jgi:PAS domain S-box-containing protein
MDVTPQAAAREILATMPDALLLLAPDGSIVTSNRSAAALFGLRPEQLAGAPTDGFFADPTAFRALATRVGAGESVVSLEMECRTAAGVAVPVSVSGRAMRDRTGEVGGMVFVLRDITGRKQAEAELARAQAELVKHEKLATLDQVAGSIAHELRNPLGAVNNAVYFLKLTVGDELRGRMARHLDIIEEEVTRSNRIITSLLDYSQERYSVRGPCRLEDLVSRVLKRVQLPGSVEVETRLAADLPSIVADPGQIEQALLNIVTNSVQAMAAGGRLAIAAVRQNGTVRVTLSDSGPGIAPEHMQRLFEPLFSTKTFGVGLGLSIARAFVEASKGTITMESEVGRGTTVTVTLPVA